MKNETICKVCNSTSEDIRTIKSEIFIKGKRIVVEAPRRLCTNCNQIKFDKVLDQEFSLLAIKQYNEQHGIPGEKIVKLREQFGISQETLGKVLGIAKKTIVSYEHNRAVPNDSYFTLLQSLINDPSKLIDYANINKNSLSEYEIKKIYDGNHSLLNLSYDPFQFVIQEEPTSYNGYRVGSKERIMNIIQYAASKINGKTKLAKTLFIADALYYSDTTTTLTGMKYAAINNGPIPEQFDAILDYMQKLNMISLHIEEISNYTLYNYSANKLVKLNCLEKEYLDKAIAFTSTKTAKKLSDLTHKLDIWKKADIGDIMSFDLLDSFSLDNWN